MEKACRYWEGGEDETERGEGSTDNSTGEQRSDKKKEAGDIMGKTDRNKWLGYLELFQEPSLFCFNQISFIRNVFISLQKTANTLTRLQIQIQIYKYEAYSLKRLSIMDFFVLHRNFTLDGLGRYQTLLVS